MPNFLDSKKPVKPNRYGASKSPYAHRPSYGGSKGYGGSGPTSLPGLGHDFKPSRGVSGGGGGGGSAGYSYSSGIPSKGFDDYNDGPSYRSPSSAGPSSFVSVSSSTGEDDPDGIINIDHGTAAGDGYDPADDHRYRYRQPTSSPKGSGRYEDPLHPLRDYHSTAHDGEDMYVRPRHEYRSKGRASKSPAAPSSPYYRPPHFDDYGEPSSTSVQSKRPSTWDERNDGGGGKGKAYWSMSYVQNF